MQLLNFLRHLNLIIYVIFSPIIFLLWLIKGKKREKRYYKSQYWGDYGAADHESLHDVTTENYPATPWHDPAYAEEQIDFVSGADFHKKNLMNGFEFKTFKTVQRWVIQNSKDKGYRLFAQVCIGEYIGTDDDPAFHSINSKRVDLLIIDRFGKAITAIECQGSGHNKGNSELRDQIKRLVHQKVDVGYIEIFPGDSPVSISQKLDAICNPSASLPPS